jgi:hypothetical protein
LQGSSSALTRTNVLLRAESTGEKTRSVYSSVPNVATEMALHVLAYNLTRVLNIVGIKPLLVAIRA